MFNSFQNWQNSCRKFEFFLLRFYRKTLTFCSNSIFLNNTFAPPKEVSLLLTFKLLSSIFSWNWTKVDILTCVLNILTISIFLKKPHSSIFLTWPPSRMNFIAFLRYNYIYIFQNIMFLKDTNFFHLLLRINSKFCRLASGAHFPPVFMIFKTAISFKVFIVGISVFSKTCWKLNFTAI